MVEITLFVNITINIVQSVETPKPERFFVVDKLQRTALIFM
jgi:hypothetical protein